MSDAVLVTGGAGFIGRHVLRELDDAGYTASALTHTSSLPERAEDTVVETVAGDITRFDTLPTFEPYDVVVHLAGAASVGESLADPRSAYEVNTTGTVNVFERAREGDVETAVYVSSAAVYGVPEELPITESEPVDALHPYAASKLAGEHVATATANAYELDVAIARPFTTYGPGQQSDNLIPQVISRLREGADVLELGNLSPTRDFVHVHDVASAIRTIVERDPAADVYNVGSEEETTVRSAVEHIRELMGSDAEIESGEKRDERVEIPRMVSDCTRLRELGWRPEFDVESGLEHTIDREHHD